MAINTTTASAIAHRSGSGRTGGPLASLRAAFGRWQERALVRYELQQMTDRELADLGLSASDIEEVASGTYRRGD